MELFIRVSIKALQPMHRVALLPHWAGIQSQAGIGLAARYTKYQVQFALANQ